MSPQPLTHDWMHMTGEVPLDLAEVGLEPDKLYAPANGQFITAILREIEFELLATSGEGNPLLELKYRELLLKLARAVRNETVETGIKSTMKAQMRQVRSHIFSRMDYNWTVQEMAELAYVSASRFHTVYRTVFGISPMDDLIHARVDTAKNRLCNSDESIHQLAADLGYRNVTHFCRQFKKITGLTPMEFRKTQEGHY
jgi:AraC-like DNA-binding protein